MKRELCEARCCLPKLRGRIVQHSGPGRRRHFGGDKGEKVCIKEIDAGASGQQPVRKHRHCIGACCERVIELTAGYGSTDVYHLVWARDTVMQVLILYMDFIRQHNLQQYVASLPVLSELINTYNIEMSLAMFIVAPCYHKEISASGFHSYSISTQIPLIIAAQTRESLDTITPDFYAAF